MNTTHSSFTILSKRFYFIKDVECLIGRSRLTLRRWWTSGKFPKPFKLTREVFRRLNPNDELFDAMMTALCNQIYVYRQHKSLGFWVPHWRYPANWLIQEGWKDELINYLNSDEAASEAEYLED